MCKKNFSFWGLPYLEPPDWPVFILGLSGGIPSPEKR